MIKKILASLILGSVLMGNSAQAGQINDFNKQIIDSQGCPFEAYGWIVLTEMLIQELTTIEESDSTDPYFIIYVTEAFRLIEAMWNKNLHLNQNIKFYKTMMKELFNSKSLERLSKEEIELIIKKYYHSLNLYFKMLTPEEKEEIKNTIPNALPAITEKIHTKIQLTVCI